jgi:capsular polysaccharide transport system permease protein
MSSSNPDTLFNAVVIQSRVVFALIMREIITRYGRHNIGFAWLFAEPMLFTMGVTALWSVVHSGESGRINIIAFAVTSYSTVLVWRNTIGRCTLAVEPNLSLLFHRNVRVIDLFVARIVLEIVGITLSVITLMTIFIVIGLIPPPSDILTMVGGWLLLAWYSAAMGLLVGGLCEYSEMVERFWHPIAYFQLPVSGAFALASWLPPRLREVVLWFPAANCVEIFRSGYFGSSIKSYYDVGYVVLVCALLTWMGLATVKFISSKVEH